MLAIGGGGGGNIKIPFLREFVIVMMTNDGLSNFDFCADDWDVYDDEDDCDLGSGGGWSPA